MSVGRSTAGGLGRAVGRRKPHHWAQQQAGSIIITVCDTFPIYSSRLTAPALSGWLDGGSMARGERKDLPEQAGAHTGRSGV
jgi:hypothetical protein